jgi:hypothetical protein
MTQAEIGGTLGVTQHVIWRLMQHHTITARPAVIRAHVRGPRHPFWKGEAATYKAFHLRLYTLRGAERRCNRCGTTDPRRAYDWANLTGHYADLDDYERMCRHCHRRYDRDRRNDPATSGALNISRD